MAKRPQVLNSVMGSVLVWILVGLIVVSVGAVVVMKRLPINPVAVPKPVVVRGEIPPLPAAPPVTQPDTSQATAVEETTPPLQENNEAPASGISSDPMVETPLSGEPPDLVVSDATGAAQKPEISPTVVSSGGEPVASPDSPASETPAVEDTTGVADQMANNDSADASDTTEAETPDTAQAAGQPLAETDDQTVVDDGVLDDRTDQSLTDSEPPEATVDESAPFSIQVGAFHTEAYAQKLAAALEERGYSTYIETFIEDDQPPLYQVRFGRFGSLEAAVRSVEDFKNRENRSAVVVKVPTR